MVNISGGGDAGVSYTFNWDYSEVRRALAGMDIEANKLMSKAISGVLRKEMETTRRNLKRGVRGMSGSMQDIVADSLVVESGTMDGGAAVRFGADPIDRGGPSSRRKTGSVAYLAQMLETGIPSFEYGFKDAMKINQGSSGRSYAGWINKSKDSHFPGIKPVEWLKSTLRRAEPQIPDAVTDALDTAWGGGKV